MHDRYPEHLVRLAQTIAGLGAQDQRLPEEFNRRIVARCTHYHDPTNTLLIFTADQGMHSSGMWKNPDFDRCWHLSISFAWFDEWGNRNSVPFDRKLAEAWATLFFRGDHRNCWIEPPASEAGKKAGVHHYRLFCDAAWNPIRPRGELYSKRNTPAGWKSWSDIHSS